MREVIFDTAQEVPEINVVIQGPRQKVQPRVIFDTGSGLTQIDIQLIETIGYSAKNAIRLCSVQGVTEHTIEGYVVTVKELQLFGLRFKDIPVLTYDFDAHPTLDGLLGFDIIKKLHIEMNGPKGLLKVF